MLKLRQLRKECAAAARDILVNYEISQAVFIPNTPRNRAISYTNNNSSNSSNNDINHNNKNNMINNDDRAFFIIQYCKFSCLRN